VIILYFFMYSWKKTKSGFFLNERIFIIKFNQPGGCYSFNCFGYHSWLLKERNDNGYPCCSRITVQIVIKIYFLSKNDNRDTKVSIIKFWLSFILFNQQVLESGFWIFKNASIFKGGDPPSQPRRRPPSPHLTPPAAFGLLVGRIR